MKKLLLSLFLLLTFASTASAQNPTCPTRPSGDSTNACASTAFVQNASSGAIINITKPPYNAICNGTTVNATATIQSAVTDAISQNALLFIPGNCVYQGTVTIPGAIEIFGTNTATSALIGNSTTQPMLLVTSTSSVIFRDLTISNLNPMTAGYGVKVSPAGLTQNTNTFFQNVVFLDLWTSIWFEKAAYFVLDNIKINQMPVGSTGIIVANTTSGDSGDSTIVNSTITTSGTTEKLIDYQSSGGLRILNNKLIGGAYGVYGAINSSSGILLIEGNSIESQAQDAIYIVPGAGITFRYVNIVGNHIDGDPAHSMIFFDGGAGASVGPNLISSNILFRVPNTLNANVIRIASGGNYNISSNTINGATAGSAISIAAAVTDSVVGCNQLEGIAISNSSTTTLVLDCQSGATPKLAIGGALSTTGSNTLSALTTAGPVITSSAGLLSSEAQLAVARGGTGLASGTSGGVLAFTGTTTISSSGLLTQFGPLYGGGNNAVPGSMAAGTDGQIIVGQTSAAPLWKTASGNCSIAASGAITCAAAGLTVGTSVITGGTTTRVLYDNAGVLGEYTNTQLTALINPATATLSGALPAWPNNSTTFFRGDGTYTAVGLSALATQATNTVVGNATSGTAAPTALAVGTCSTSSSALIWTTNTGFGCNTSINAATLGSATFASPGAIGGTTPAVGNFTGITLTLANATIDMRGVTGNGVFIGATGGFLFNNHANSVTIATLSDAGSYSIVGSFITTSTTDATNTASGALQIPGGASINKRVFMNGLSADTASTDRSICQDTTSFELKTGTGALGVCLGTSGRQFKTAFEPMQVGLAEIMQIPMMNYHYLNGYGDGGERKQFGPIAQDVEAVIPSLARHNANGVTINYDWGGLLFVGLKAIQELKADNDNIHAELLKIRGAR